MRSVLAALVAAAVLAACGSGGSGGSDGSTDAEQSAPPAETEAPTSLTIVVTADAGVPPQTYTLTCDPAGGEHPQAQQACEALDAAGAAVLEPVPADQACTRIYGGPQVATVTGTYEGADVDATFSRSDGCEIDRWEQLGTTFFDVPML